MSLVAIGLVFIGAVLMLSGTVLTVVAAFQQSLLWGLGYLFVPFVQVIFVFLHWARAKKGFWISMAGMGFLLLATMTAPQLRTAAATAAHLPALAPRPPRKTADDFAAEIEAQRDDLANLQDQASRAAAEAGRQYAALAQRRQQLDLHDQASVHQFNLDAAAYKQQTQLMQQLARKITAGNTNLDQLLAQQAVAPRKVIIYTTSWCSVCKAAKHYMDSKGIEYEEVDVEKSAEGREAFARYGGNGVPLIVVGDKTMRGFNPDALDAML